MTGTLMAIDESRLLLLFSACLAWFLHVLFYSSVGGKLISPLP
jgi:hypothetical protein